MEVMGIKFAPLDIPLHRRLQTLAAGAWIYTMVLGSFVGTFLAAYLIFFTSYWLGTILYLIWMFTIDKDTCERGSRALMWVRKLKWWEYMKDYFPMQLETVAGVELDPKRNYLFCSFPHGILCTGVFLAFATEAGGFRKLFPRHTSSLLTLKQNFNRPYFRELIYSLGLCSSSEHSINWLLKYPGGGKVAVLVVGGTAEAFYCRPGKYHLNLNNRKGFVRLAMQNGTSLVPVFSFGETDIFDQVDNPIGSPLRTFQEWVKKLSGLAPLIPIGRGFLQYTFGVVPQRKPITTLIGKPLEVEKVENPTKEQIDAVHKKFVDHLVQLFEEEKHKYIEDPDNIKLVIN